jgi:hypothetical protein
MAATENIAQHLAKTASASPINGAGGGRADPAVVLGALQPPELNLDLNPSASQLLAFVPPPAVPVVAAGLLRTLTLLTGVAANSWKAQNPSLVNSVAQPLAQARAANDRLVGLMQQYNKIIGTTRLGTPARNNELRALYQRAKPVTDSLKSAHQQLEAALSKNSPNLPHELRQPLQQALGQIKSNWLPIAAEFMAKLLPSQSWKFTPPSETELNGFSRSRKPQQRVHPPRGSAPPLGNGGIQASGQGGGAEGSRSSANTSESSKSEKSSKSEGDTKKPETLAEQWAKPWLDNYIDELRTSLIEKYPDRVDEIEAKVAELRTPEVQRIYIETLTLTIEQQLESKPNLTLDQLFTCAPGRCQSQCGGCLQHAVNEAANAVRDRN